MTNLHARTARRFTDELKKLPDENLHSVVLYGSTKASFSTTTEPSRTFTTESLHLAREILLDAKLMLEHARA